MVKSYCLLTKRCRESPALLPASLFSPKNTEEERERESSSRGGEFSFRVAQRSYLHAVRIILGHVFMKTMESGGWFDFGSLSLSVFCSQGYNATPIVFRHTFSHPPLFVRKTMRTSTRFLNSSIFLSSFLSLSFLSQSSLSKSPSSQLRPK